MTGELGARSRTESDTPAGALPLTPGQASIWFGQEAAPDSGAFQCAEFLEFRSAASGDRVDPELLAEVIRDALALIPVLQSEFTTDSAGRPVLVPRPHQFDVARIDVPAGTDPIDWSVARISRPPASPGRLHGDDLSGHALLAIPGGGIAWLARFHHIIGDGLAIGAIIRWIAARYTAALADEPLPEPPFLAPEEMVAELPEDDFDPGAPAANRSDVADAGGATAEFWRSHENPIPLDQDPLGAPRAPSAEPRIVSVHADIPRDARAALGTVTRALSSNEMAALTAIAAHYVAAFSGSGCGPDAEPVNIGLPLMNRPLGQSSTAIDPRVNVLPLVIAAKPTVAGTIAETTRRLDELRTHGSYRAELLRRDLGITDPDRALTGPSVNYRPFGTSFSFAGVPARLTTVSVGPVHDLEFLFQSSDDGGLDLHVMADTHHHDRDSAQAHADRLAALVARVAAHLGEDPETPWSAVPLARPEELAPVLGGFNDTDRDLAVPADSTVASLLAECRRADLADPVRAAARGLWFRGEEIDREQMWAEVDALADAFRASGIGPGDIVAVHLRRGPALCLGIAAICSLGAAWTPLSPDLPRERLERMLSRANPRALLCAPEATLEAPEIFRVDPEVLRPSSTLTPRRGTSTADASTLVDASGTATPGDPAYILFTSGSTGEPKAVQVPQVGIVNRLEWMCSYYGLGPADTLMQKTPCSFDVSVWEFLLPFTHGLGLAVAEDGAHKDPLDMAAALRDSSTTFCHFVPSALKVFLDAHEQSLPDLRQVVVSGEALDPGLARSCIEHLGVQLHNLYGPTEASIDVTAHTCRGEHEIPIGRPVWNTRCYVLDDLLRPLPIGARGQLFLAGVQLADGYLGQDQLTAERFVPVPFDEPGRAGHGRMYATGDIASWRPDGALLYHGRNDFQIKLRGQRLELGEIEAVIAGAPGVSMCTVLARELAGGLTLMAYVVPVAGAAGSAEGSDDGFREEVLRHAAAALPEYMVPLVVILDSLPMTVNGKLDAAALPDPADFAEVEEPESPTERIVVEELAATLGKAGPVSVAANFFDLGGNSLTAVRLAAALSERFGERVSVADVFAAKTARKLAAAIDTGEDGAPGADAFAPLFALREHSTGVPVFCLHPAGGLGWAYAGLIRELAPGRGVFAVQSPGLAPAGVGSSHADSPHTGSKNGPTDGAQRAPTLGAAARRAAEDIAAKAAALGADTVDLVGWSVGGVLAQEVAICLSERAESRREARRGGASVRRVVLMDSYPAELWSGLPAPTDDERLEGLLTMAGIDRASVAPAGEPLAKEDVREAIRGAGGTFGTLPDTVLSGVIDMIGHNARLMREHTTRPYHGEIRFLRAGRNSAEMDAASWAPHVREIATTTLDVTHPGLVSPASLRIVGEALS
ncbi:amino acid adenylation domain-containing protein [Dietzia sp.]|uniref:amino acid adenylation domain-containing protein n=1 Tax=Dietzia sp. TaxID=1871616 RepID=UPI002FDA1728